MAKTIHRIDNEDHFDFLLLGIVYQQKDFRLCHQLNTKLELEMRRKEDLDVFNSKRMEEQGFSFFEYQNMAEDQYCLLANKSNRGLLIPEQKQMDYFLLIRVGRSDIDVKVIQQQVKEIPMVLGVYILDASKLKSRENLLF